MRGEDILKTVLTAAIIVALVALTTVAPWLTAGLGYLSLVSYGFILGHQTPSDLAYEKRAKKEQKREMRQARRQMKEMYYTPKKGWKTEAFPVGLTANIPNGKAASITLDAAGIRNLISAEYGKDGVMFSFLLKDEKKSLNLERLIREKRYDVNVERLADGTFMVKSMSADVIAALVDAAYPQKDVKAEIEVSHSRQYILHGFTSYDEALKYYQENKDSLSPSNSFTSVKTSVDGEEISSEGSGKALDKAAVVSLPTGAYVITDSDVESKSAVIRVPGDVVDPEDIKHFAADKLADMPSDGNTVKQTVLSNGTPEGIGRYLSEGGENYRLVDSKSDSVVAASGLKAFVVLKSFEEMQALAGDGVIKEGTFVSVGTTKPDGKFVVEVDIKDAETLKRFALQEGPGSEALDLAVKYGVSKEDLAFSRMLSDVDKNGYALGVVSSGVSLDSARINGVGMDVLSERLTNPRLERLDGAGIENWLKDSAQIQSVNITVDPQRAEMKITSRVNDAVRVEVRPLTDKELKAFQERGKITKSELKDLLMQTHPDFFKTYAGVKTAGMTSRPSVYVDPVRDFLAGKRPERKDGRRTMGPKPEKKVEKKAGNGPKVH